ncbi:MFS transporter [Methanoculleus taiwanensis]|uniref:MFS transporter n=1 Tax=Methanoculleus taiwanensis TaxID=1550565 RepID=UPI000FFF22E9|nr:MFS transporter [Methanoculleus taiwanensis]
MMVENQARSVRQRQSGGRASSRTVVLPLVILVIFMDMTVYSLVIPVLPSYIRLLGADAVMIGIIFGMYSAMMFLFSVPMGMLSDRVGRRPVLLAGMVLLAVSTVVFGFATTVSSLIAARIIQGISAAATWSAGLALLADTYDRTELGEKMGVTMSAMGVGMVIGPVAGGYLYEHVGYALTFVVPSVAAGLVAFMILILPLGLHPPPSRRSAALLPESGRLHLALYAAAVVAVAATYGIIEPYLPVYLADSFASSPVVVGLVLGLLALVGVVAQPFAGRLSDRYGGHILVTVGLSLSGIALALVMAMPDLLLVAVAVSLMGITLSLALIPTMPLIADLYRGEGAQGIAFGIYNTFFSVGLAVGPFAGALLTGLLLPRTLFLFHAAFLAVTGVFGFFMLRNAHFRRGGRSAGSSEGLTTPPEDAPRI